MHASGRHDADLMYRFKTNITPVPWVLNLNESGSPGVKMGQHKTQWVQVPIKHIHKSKSKDMGATLRSMYILNAQGL